MVKIRKSSEWENFNPTRMFSKEEKSQLINIIEEADEDLGNEFIRHLPRSQKIGDIPKEELEKIANEVKRRYYENNPNFITISEYLSYFDVDPKGSHVVSWYQRRGTDILERRIPKLLIDIATASRNRFTSDLTKIYTKEYNKPTIPTKVKLREGLNKLHEVLYSISTGFEEFIFYESSEEHMKRSIAENYQKIRKNEKLMGADIMLIGFMFLANDYYKNREKQTSVNCDYLVDKLEVDANGALNLDKKHLPHIEGCDSCQRVYKKIEAAKAEEVPDYVPDVMKRIREMDDKNKDK